MPQEPTNQEILDAINAFSTANDSRLDKMDNRFDKMDNRFDKIERTMTTLVTKDYLDDKLADLKGDIIVTIRKEDGKMRKLIDILKQRNVISEEEVKSILSMEPFPQLYI